MNTPNKENTIEQPWAKFDDDLTDEMVSVVPPNEEAAIEESLELQMISIRLQKSLIAQLKMIAEFHKTSYQPLIRDLLNRFARSEIRIILDQLIKQKQEMLKKIEIEPESEPQTPAVDEFLAREAKRKYA